MRHHFNLTRFDEYGTGGNVVRIFVLVCAAMLCVDNAQAQWATVFKGVDGAFGMTISDEILNEVKAAAELRAQPREPQTYYEREAMEYAKAYKSDDSTSVQDYWRHRLDLADRLDKGQISLETANELLKVYSDQAMREIAAAAKAEEQRAAQAQARADAAAR